MCIFYSISSFRSAIRELQSSKKDGYKSVWEDVVNEFETKKTLDEIKMTPSMIKLYDNIKIIKARIPNSYLDQSKSNGYRLIYMVRLDRNEVVLLYIYPKRGRKKINNIKDSTYIELLNIYKTELESGDLVRYDNIKINQ